MDAQTYSKLLSYIFCELSIPVKEHVFNFVKNNNSSMNLLIAAARAAKKDRHKNSKLHLPRSNLKRTNLKNDTLNYRPSDSFPIAVHERDLNEEVKYHTVSFEESLADTMQERYSEEYTAEIHFNQISNQPNEVKDNIAHEVITNYQENDILQESVEELGLTDMVVSDQLSDLEQEESQINLEINESDCQVPEVLCDDSETRDEMSYFYSDPLLLCSEFDFKVMFRMTRTTFQKLLEFLSKEDMEPIDNVPLYKKALIVLWLLGNSGSYSDAAQVFGVTEEAAANCFFDVCATLYNSSESFISWPSIEQRTEISTKIENKYGFPGVVGVIGCHYFSISIPKEALSRREHFNAKLRTYCIALQIVCDDRLVIRDISPGLPGSIPEAQVLRESPLCEQLLSNTQPNGLVEPHKHILARSEYPQLTSMLTPYKATATLSEDEVEFNKLHENVCQLVDQTFQMLQERFLTLKLLDPEVATMVLVAACVLHNICVENDDIFETYE